MQWPSNHCSSVVIAPAAAVAATGASDRLASFSNWGKASVHLGAPGVNILSTSFKSDSSYEYLSGTSMATPVVSGAAALLFAAKPDATLAQVRWAGAQHAGAIGRVLSHSVQC